MSVVSAPGGDMDYAVVRFGRRSPCGGPELIQMPAARGAGPGVSILRRIGHGQGNKSQADQRRESEAG